MKTKFYNLFAPFASTSIFFKFNCKVSKVLFKHNYIFSFLSFSIILFDINYKANAQADFGSRTATIVNLSVFGGLPNNTSNDTWAFIKASKWAQNLWDKNGIPYYVAGANLTDQINTSLNYPKIELSSGNYLVGQEIDWPNFSSVMGNATPIQFKDQGTVTSTSILNLSTLLATPTTLVAGDNVAANALFVNGVTSLGTDFTFYVKYKDIFPNVDPLNNEEIGFLVSYEFYNKTPVGTNFEFTFRRFIRKYDQTPIFQIDDELAPVPVVKVLDGLEIEGVLNSTTISYEANMHNGFYEETGKAVCPICDENSEANYQVAISDMFQINNSLNVRVANIKVNGNSSNIYFEGLHIESTSDAGTQFGHNGIKFWVSKNISVENCDFNFMGLDGINIYDPIHLTDASFPGFNQNPSKYYISNCKSIFNRRQGCTVSAVDGINIEHSEFSNTGEAITALSAPPNQAQSPYTFDIELSPGNTIIFPCIPNILHSKPSAGMDIEPEGDNVKNGIVTECIFKNNYRCEIVADGNGDVYNPTEPENYGINWKFKECLIEDDHHQGPGILIWQRQYLFDDCDINTGFLNGCKASILGDETKFTNCRFSDKTTSGSLTDNQNLIYSEENALRLTFDNCKFNVFGAMNHAFHILPASTPANSPNLQEYDYNIMKNCEVTYHSSSSSDDKLESLYGFRFQDNNKIISHDNTNFKQIRLCNSIFEGSPSVCAPNTFDIGGKISLHFHSQLDNIFVTGRIYNTIGSNDDGYFNFNIENEAILQALPVTGTPGTNDPIVSIDINRNVQFNNKEDGSIKIQYCSATFKGKLINHKNSYINFDNTLFYSTLSDNPFFYFDANAYYGIYPSPSIGFYTNYSLSTPLLGNVPPCIQGGNTQANGFHCAPDIYSNISTNGAFPIMYNLTPNGVNTDINYTPSVNDYTVSFDGFPVTTNLITNVSDGCHTLLITNTITGCWAVAFITIGNGSPCCEPTFDNTQALLSYVNPDASTLIPLTGSTVSNKTIIIDGTFTVDQSMTFNGCTFLMRDNASIVIDPGNTLTLNICTLKAACTAMWNGVYAGAYSSEVIIYNSILQDMQYGVNISNGAKTNCQNNTFIDNFVGMHFENTPAGYVSVGGNKGIVLNNTFTSTGNNLLIPQQTETLACTGIEILNCKELEIGELVSHSNNTFNAIRTGINIVPKANDYNIIRLLNNNYLNIHKDFSSFTYPEEELTKKFYTKDKGAGIFVPNPNSPNSSNSRIVHVEALPNDGRFEDCDKAFAANNISANVIGYTIQNCKGGLLFNDARAQLYWVESNNIDNAFIGMQFLGNLQKAVVVNHMSTYGAGIATQKDPIAIDPAQNAGNERLWPKGIDIEFTDYKHLGYVLIDNNAINLRAIGGKGIALSLTGPGVTARNNSVVFSTQDESDDEGVTLVGIQSLISLGNHLNCNAVSGYYNNAVWQKRNSQGMLLYQTGQSNIDCNAISNTWHGTLAYGDNTTDPKNVKGNTYNHHAWGMLFVPSIFTPEGTLGDIGSSTADNNNRFNGTYVNPGGWNVFRYCNPGSSTIFHSIFTVQPIVSGNFGGQPYFPIPAPNPYNCETSECILNSEDPHNPFIDEENAEDLVNDDIQFPYFPEVGEWVAERRLFADLDEDSVARLSNTLLNTFYIQKSQETMGDILMAEKALNLLSDSLSSADSTVYDQRLTNAITANNAISSIHNYEQNERTVNYLYLKIAMIGRDSLDNSDLETLETLAKSCPAIEGTAVYKARTLYAMYEPALDYNDLQICGTSVSNKNGENSFDNLSAFLQSAPIEYYRNMSGNDMSHFVKDTLSGFGISPNPANDILNIDHDLIYNQDAIMIVYDLLGGKVMNVILSGKVQRTTLDVHMLPSGLYTYRIEYRNNRYIGKFSIVR